MERIYERFGRTLENALILFFNARLVLIGLLKTIKSTMMKVKFLLTTATVLGCFTAFAADIQKDPEYGKKDELNGTVVHSQSKRPLKDVSITAYLISKKEKITLTDDMGTYSFDELKPGVYKFVFEKAGYKRMTKEKVVIKTDEAFQMNIEMMEQDDFEIIPSPFHFTGGVF